MIGCLNSWLCVAVSGPMCLVMVCRYLSFAFSALNRLSTLLLVLNFKPLGFRAYNLSFSKAYLY